MYQIIVHLLSCYFVTCVCHSGNEMQSYIKSNQITIPFSFHWTHSSIENQALYCWDCCKKSSIMYPLRCNKWGFVKDSTAVCCMKSGANPFWTFPYYSHLVGTLSIEYNQNSPGHSDIIYSGNESKPFYFLNHWVGNMTHFPDNICVFPNIVTISLVGNKLDSLPDLTCLKYLDILNLDHNRITKINGSVLSGMSYLRILVLSFNYITHIDADAFNYRPGSLMEIYLYRNRLVSIDISNIFLNYRFKEIHYGENRISVITNNLNWEGVKDGDDVGGLISLGGNNFTLMPPLYLLGFKDDDSAMKISFNFEINLHNNPFFCDCVAYEYIKVAMAMTLHFIGLQFECANPPKLDGYSPQRFAKKRKMLDYLICNITLAEKCPPKCYCFRQPSHTRVVINCSWSSRSKMPSLLPDFHNLDLDLSHNMIQTFENYAYMKRVKKIDLSYNAITAINPFVYGIKTLEFIILHNNKITTIDRTLQQKDPCKVWLGKIEMKKCKCDMAWIKLWLDRPTARDCPLFQNFVTCTKDGKSLDIQSLSDNDLCQYLKSYISYLYLSVPIFVIFIGFSIYKNYHNDIYILIRKDNTSRLTDNIYKQRFDYDLYFSFDLENSEIRAWVIKVLCCYLEKLGYKVCIPYRDFESGGSHIDQIRMNIVKSQSFCVLLSQGYLESQHQTTEWRHIWHAYTSDNQANIIVINFDSLESKLITNRKLKAFVRTGHYVDFSNFDKLILDKIRSKLKPPILRAKKEYSGGGN